MVLQDLGNTLNGSFQGVWGGVVSYVPAIFWAIVIFIIGWIIGALIGKLVAHLIRAIKLDSLLEQAGFGGVMKRAGMNLNSAAFIGGLVEWFIIIVFLVASLQILGLSDVNAYMKGVVVGYIPQLIVAILIVLASIVIADVVSRLVTSSVRAAGIKSAHFLGALTKWAIWLTGFFIALPMMGIGVDFIHTLYTGIIVALALAFGLSFGLGGQEAAARWIERTREEIRSHHE